MSLAAVLKSYPLPWTAVHGASGAFLVRAGNGAHVAMVTAPTLNLEIVVLLAAAPGALNAVGALVEGEAADEVRQLLAAVEDPGLYVEPMPAPAAAR